MIPREDNASDHVMELLKPHTTENGGPLEVERVHFTPGRGNLIIKYPGKQWCAVGVSTQTVCPAKYGVCTTTPDAASFLAISCTIENKYKSTIVYMQFIFSPGDRCTPTCTSRPSSNSHHIL